MVYDSADAKILENARVDEWWRKKMKARKSRLMKEGERSDASYDNSFIYGRESDTRIRKTKFMAGSSQSQDPIINQGPIMIPYLLGLTQKV